MTIWDPFWVSLRAALLATLIVAILGFLVGYWLAHSRFHGRWAVEALLTLPVALPPTVLGYYLLVTLGRNSPIGGVWQKLTGHDLVFTFTGIVIAQAVQAFPYGMRAARAAVEDVDLRYEQLAASMGLTRLRTVMLVTLPLARGGLIVGCGLAFGRALGDYGATLALSSGPKTTTMPIDIVNQLFNGDPDLARQLALVQIGLAVAIMVAISRVGRTRAI